MEKLKWLVIVMDLNQARSKNNEKQDFWKALRSLLISSPQKNEKDNLLKRTDSEILRNEKLQLLRFVHAQKTERYNVKNELASGEKKGHWMWYTFPQIAGLSRSSNGRYFAIKSTKEAKEYLEFESIGKNLIEDCHTLLSIENKSAEKIFGNIDAIKLKSSMTLFALTNPQEKVFKLVLDKYFDGKMDLRTVVIVNSEKEKK